MLYIDFDGVILDTEEELFREWRMIPNHKNLSEEEKIKYIKKKDWNYVLNNSSILNDSVYYLKQMDPSTSFILTKIHSLENEGYQKINWIRNHDIKQSVILVPYLSRKADVVDANNNILIDDCLKNLDEWVLNGGIPVLFDVEDDNIDTWNKPNINGYQKVLSLSKFSK